MIKTQQNKYHSFCSHNFQKSLTNQIKVPCKDNDELIHIVSQIGKICNKCTSSIIRSIQKQSLPCIICSDNIQQYLSKRQLCPHDEEQQTKIYNEVVVNCNKNNAKFHQVPLHSPVCKICHDKIRAVFNGNPDCPVCQGKQNQTLDNLQKTLASPAINYMRNLIKALKNQADQNIIQNQIELYCLAPLGKNEQGQDIMLQDKHKSVLSEQFRNSYENSAQSHPSKRYFLYPKCPKHRQRPLNLCNQCLVAVLNLQTCPYGCYQQGPAIKQRDNVKVYEAGFLTLSAKKNTNNQGYHLQMIVIRHIQEKGRLDRWEGQLRKLKPYNPQTQKLMHFFTLYSSVVYISQKRYLLTGGKLNLKSSSSNISLQIHLSQDNKQFIIKQVANMHIKRAAHSLVYDQSRQLVFAIGGFSQDNFLKQCEGYNLRQGKWLQMANLNIQRSKATAMMHKNNLYVFGGLTRNQYIGSYLVQQYSFSENKWNPLVFEGYQYPFITGMTPSSIIPSFYEKQVLLFGGSNYSGMTSYIQNIQFYKSSESKAFRMNNSNFLNLEKMNFNRCNPLIAVMNPITPSKTKQGDIKKQNEKVIVVFGGLQEHEQILTIDAVRVRQSEDLIEPIFTYDQSIQIGSYKLLIREDAEKVYQQMKNNLIEMNVLNQGKLEKPEIDEKNKQKQKQKQKQKGKKNIILSSPNNMRLIQNLWFGTGRSIVSVTMGPD